MEMQNLKIKVNNEAESKEVQELFFEMGYYWNIGLGVRNLDAKFLYVWNNQIKMGYCSDAFRDTNYCEITLAELRAMVNQDQDEPFLTPECTLNDKYAEIEQVRKQTIEQTLAERQSTYGNFEDVAFVTENIMAVLSMARTNGLSDLPHTHRMALYMSASKMARIVNGDPEYFDNWHDIGGYAKLIEKLIKGEQ